MNWSWRPVDEMLVRTIRAAPLVCQEDDLYSSGGMVAAVGVPCAMGHTSVGSNDASDVYTIFRKIAIN